MANLLEEKLREAACFGDIYAVRTLIARNVNVNSKNAVNGWTALHWAAKRGYEDIVRLLLQNGANPDVTNNEGQKPARFSSSMAISKLLGAKTFNQMEKENLSFTPNYIENPPLFVDLLDVELMRRLPAAVNVPQLHLKQQKEVPENDVTIRVRIENSDDPDYIEFAMCRETITYQSLLKRCCEELEINENIVYKIKKGIVKIRNDDDVKRFSDIECLELFIKN